MKWSLTFDRLPSKTTIGGVVYDVAFGYRTMMAAEIEMFRQDISDEQKMLNALNLFYVRNIPPDLDAADYAVVPSRRRTSARKGGGSKTSDGAAGVLFLKDALLIYAAFPAGTYQSQADAERLPALVGVPGDVRIIGREHPDGEGYVLAYLRYERDGKGTESVYQADAKSLFPGRAADNDGESDEACQAKCRNAGICEKEDGRMPKQKLLLVVVNAYFFDKKAECHGVTVPCKGRNCKHPEIKIRNGEQNQVDIMSR